MSYAPMGQEFFFSNGSSAKDVSELVEEIKRLSPDEFSFHVNERKNDFFNWVYDLIDRDVALDIKHAMTQREFVEKLTGHHWHKEHKAKFEQAFDEYTQDVLEQANEEANESEVSSESGELSEQEDNLGESGFELGSETGFSEALEESEEELEE